MTCRKEATRSLARWILRGLREVYPLGRYDNATLEAVFVKMRLLVNDSNEQKANYTP